MMRFDGVGAISSLQSPPHVKFVCKMTEVETRQRSLAGIQATQVLLQRPLQVAIMYRSRVNAAEDPGDNININEQKRTT